MEHQENQEKILIEQESKEKMKQGAEDLFKGLKDFFRSLIDLQEGIDKEGTIQFIRDNKRIKGANAWLLMCSIMVASLGLDLNSPAVIIGAMLISPLMSPILGVGMAVGINDRKMLSISIQHFGIAILIALITSVLYFWISPIKYPTEQILIRTSPTFLDVVIAFFGGVAGIVSGSRLDKSNAIPGVAIATALMPPLCVTGYGMANGNWEIMYKSFYLFFFNAVFVAIATYLMVQFLKFPHKEFLNQKEKRKTQLFIFVFSLLLIIPSIFIFAGLLQKQAQKDKIAHFLSNNFKNSIWEIQDSAPDSLDVKLIIFRQLEEDSLEYYQTKFNSLKCNANLKIIQTDKPKNEFDREELTASLRDELFKMQEAENIIKSEKDKIIEQLHLQLDSIRSDSVKLKAIQKEIRVIFNEIEGISFGNVLESYGDTSLLQMPIFLINWKKKTTINARRRSEKRLYEYLKIRANLDTLLLK